MASLDLYTVGADLTTLAAQKCSVAASGALSTTGTVYNIAAVLERYSMSGTKEMQDIRPVTRTRRNMVALTTGTGLRITTLRRTYYGQALMEIAQTASHCSITVVEGVETFGPGYFTVGDYETGTDGDGKQTITLNLEPCDPNQVQMPYSSTRAAN